MGNEKQKTPVCVVTGVFIFKQNKMKNNEINIILSFLEKALKENSVNGNSQILLGDFCKEIISFYRNNREAKTVKSVETSCKHLIKYFHSHTKLISITIKSVQEFLSYVSKNAPKGVYVYYRTLKAVFNIAVDWNYIPQNPFRKVSLPKRQEEKIVTVIREELNKILDSTDSKVMRQLFLFAFLTGLRLSELVKLTWSNVNLSERYLTIGGANFKTKSKKIRYVPLSDEAVRIIEEIRPKILKLDSFVFSKKNGFSYSTSYVSRQFKKAVISSGVNKAIHFHSLRSGFATYLAEKGVSLEKIQKILGHKDYKTTQIYTSISLKTLKEAVKVFDIYQ